MTIRDLRRLNDAVINASARVERADLAKKLADKALDAAREDLSRALRTFHGEPTLNEVEREFCRTNNPIQAIKSVRDRLNMSLKDAKDKVDTYREAEGLRPPQPTWGNGQS
jgi:ribosomal protein L7/L12